jgi:hypothetical protein
MRPPVFKVLRVVVVEPEAGIMRTCIEQAFGVVARIGLLREEERFGEVGLVFEAWMMALKRSSYRDNLVSLLLRRTMYRETTATRF